MHTKQFWMISGFAGLFVLAASAADRQTLTGHVPAEVGKLNLQPVGRVPAGQSMHLGISLPFRNNAALGQLLKDVQNPASPNFHHYLTPAQFNEKFGPAPADYQALLDFAKAHHMTVSGAHPGHTMISVDAAASDVESAFHLALRLYPHPTESRQFFAPDTEPSLDLAVPVLAVSGLDNYVTPHSRMHPMPPGPAKPKNGSYNYPPGGTLFMGSDFRNAFAVGTTRKGAGQVVGLFELDGYTPDDITAYETEAGLPNVPLQLIRVDSTPNDPNNGDGEPPLDVQMAISMAPNLKQVNFYLGTGSEVDAILTEMADPQQNEPLPYQISSSWGTGTDNATSNCFARFASQGQTFFYAMGDEGALPVDPNGPNGTYINGAFPSDLEPYMTTVGGTELSMNGVGASWQSETVWGASGSNKGGGPSGSTGGILTSIPIPDYQKPVNMTAVGGSSSKANVPDVAMPAAFILVVVTATNGVQKFSPVGGTSCAAPLWAGFCAMVNDQALDNGQPYVGYINPAIYNIGLSPSYTSCFHDITNGNNTWSNSPNLYQAATGYDLCTGWGSPNGVNLMNALLNFSGPVYVDFNYTGPASNGSYDGPGSYNYPYKTLAAGVSAVQSGGTIIFRSGGTDAETMTISKAMNINASDGPTTVGYK